MSNRVHVSVLIPAYSRSLYLIRVLQSLSIQTYNYFEVIITDDSPDDVIESYIKKTDYAFPIKYYRNSPPKGTPLNWTEGMQYASGEWIKVIHDDDWLSDENALQLFADAAKENVDCIFSGYVAYYEGTKKEINQTISQKRFQKIKKHPNLLFVSNELGSPSTVMFRKSISELYDPALKWLVDIEAYIRMLRNYHCVYVDNPLIKMSLNETQVTNDCFRNPSVEVYEALVYYRKHGTDTHKSIKAYDAWWRLIRNLSVRENNMLKKYSRGETIPDFLQFIVRFQSFIPKVLLKSGVISKLLMSVCYCLFLSKK